DASLLHSALENVVRNAVRYTGEETSVEVELSRTQSAAGPQATLRISDCGPGVPPDPLDNARGRLTGGVGLGLAITERAVRFHGGKVTAFNRPGGGLMVEINLPLVRSWTAPEPTPEPVPAGREG